MVFAVLLTAAKALPTNGYDLQPTNILPQIVYIQPSTLNVFLYTLLQELQHL